MNDLTVIERNEARLTARTFRASLSAVATSSASLFRIASGLSFQINKKDV